MDDPGQYALFGRLTLAAFVMIAPTLCFLGLTRGLEWMRDDDLINKWARTHGHERDVTDNDDIFAALTNEHGVDTGDSSSVRCAVCGTRNQAGMTYCHSCQHQL